jgi:Rrf2 family protein
MTFTAKEDYGLRAMLDLAAHTDTTPVRAGEIAMRQQIPEQFLEQLLATLRRGELVRSTRGASGGYALARSASSVTIGEVFRVLSGAFVPAELAEDAPGDAVEATVIREVWREIRGAIRGVVDTTTLQDLLDRRGELGGDHGYQMHI